MIELNDIKIIGAEIIEETGDTTRFMYKDDLFIIRKYRDHFIIYVERILKKCTTLLFSILNEYNTMDPEATYTFDINTSTFRTRGIYFENDYSLSDMLDEMIKKSDTVIEKYVAAVTNPMAKYGFY